MLKRNHEYKYTLGDIAFFKRYYEEFTTAKERSQIKQLIQNGQLEIVHGGLVSPDEATTNYAELIRNFEAAHDFLKNEFGITPKVAW